MISVRSDMKIRKWTRSDATDARYPPFNTNADTGAEDNSNDGMVWFQPSPTIQSVRGNARSTLQIETRGGVVAHTIVTKIT